MGDVSQGRSQEVIRELENSCWEREYALDGVSTIFEDLSPLYEDTNFLEYVEYMKQKRIILE